MKRFLKNTDGNVAIVTSLSGVLLAGVAGLVTIFVQAADSEEAIQASLDAAVLAATAMPPGTKETQRIATAQAVFTTNLESAKKAGGADFVITSQPAFIVEDTEVSGRAKAKAKNPLGAALGISEMDVVSVAAARKIQSDPLCILALNGSQPASIEIYGNATLNAIDCAAQANSSDGKGMKLYGSKSKATASEFGVNGGYSGETWAPEPIKGVEKVNDPYANLPLPEAGACVDTKKKYGSAQYTLEPGTYCGGLNIGSGAEVTLNPGTYIMKDGQFSVGSGATVSGDEVMVALVGSNSYIHLMSKSATKLTSPRSGTYKNMQFMSDRDLSSSKFQQEWTTVLGGATLDYDGVMYLPEQQFWVGGTLHNVVINANSPSLAIVADKIWLQGNVVMQVTQENKRGLQDVAQAPSFGYGARLVR